MASVELLNELLRAIVDVLDVRDVFPRIAQTAREPLQRVAPAVRERRL